jgi:putative membrane protein
MHRNATIGAALILSFGMLAACNNNTTTETTTEETTADSASPAPGENSEAVSAVQDAAAAAVGTASAELTTTTEGFVQAAAMSDMYEIEAGKIAAERAHSAEIKAFANEMVAAHTKTSATLKAKLAEGNVSVALPTELDARHKGMIDNLTGAAPEDFDQRYTNQQVNAHEEAVILFRGYSENGENAVLKAAAAETLPLIQQHLEHIKNLDEADVDQQAQPE